MLLWLWTAGRNNNPVVRTVAGYGRRMGVHTSEPGAPMTHRSMLKPQHTMDSMECRGTILQVLTMTSWGDPACVVWKELTRPSMSRDRL
jgi:hypothetical protein